WILHPKLADDIGLDVRSSCSGKREHRRTAEPLADCPQREIVGAEIVSPLAHAVRLIDDKETDRAREEMLEKRTILEALGGEVQHFSLAFSNLAVSLSRLGGREVRVHRDGAHAL